VQVHRLVTEGTVEDRISQLLERKRALADAVVSSGEGWITELSNDDLADLVSLQRDEWDNDAFTDDDTAATGPAGSPRSKRVGERSPRGRPERRGGR